MERLHQSRRRDVDRDRLVHRTLPADLLTPVAAAARLRDAGRRVCLLESAGGPTSLAHFTFCALDPELGVVADDTGVRVRRGDDERSSDRGVIDKLRELTAELRLPPAPQGLPPFHGGLVGYLGYEVATELEPTVPRIDNDPLGAPRARFEAYRTVVAFDHRAQRLVLSTACRDGEREYAAANARLDELEAQLFGSAAVESPRRSGFRVAGMEPTTGADSFMEGVERLRHAIGAGEIFQAVPSRRLVGDYAGDPFELYRALRIANSAPHMFFFETDEVTLVGSSPERLVEVDAGRVRTVPIAGTRPRGVDARHDRELEAELLASPKERSEHDMLVDLARNDLGRIARIGSVEVVEHARCLRFRRVQHLVSRVEADLRADRDALDALAACFPAGTVSGAPKVRAMQLLAEIETERRGPYAGAFGYLDHRGGLDAAICIRTFVATGGRLALQAGAGVVHDSDPAAELAEVDAKLAGPLGALELLDTTAGDAADGTTGDSVERECEEVLS